jgi:two-component system, OmpR family, sensor histidine kinase PrrB
MALRSLSGRLVAAACVAVVLPILITMVGWALVVEHQERRGLDREILNDLRTLRRPAEALLGIGPGEDRPAPPVGGLDLDGGFLTRVVAPDGRTQLERGSPEALVLPVVSATASPATIESRGERWRSAAVPLDGGGALQVAAPLGPVEERVGMLRLAALLSFAAAVATTVVLARFTVRRTLAPLIRLRRAASGIGRDVDGGKRVPEEARPVETADLARELNAMLDRLRDALHDRDRALAGARRFAADAGHELRTPLTSLTLGVAALGRGDRGPVVLGMARDDLTRLSTLVAQLQALARGEQPLTGRSEPVDLGELVYRVSEEARRRHPGLRISVDAPASGPIVHGEPQGLRSVVDNLVENVARHAGPTPAAVVTVSSSVSGTRLLVDDDGPGVAADERASILGRFARGSAAAPGGSGLGLAIVVTEARRHGGDVQVGASPSGGFRVRVTFSTAAVPVPGPAPAPDVCSPASPAAP